MAKVRIKHPDTGVVYTVDVDNLTAEDLRRLERLNIAEEVKDKVTTLEETFDKLILEEKPKRKKKKMSDKHRTTEYYKNVDNKKDEKPSYEEVEEQELDEYLNEKQDGKA